jgi:rhodanese-related sulfurtransferase
VQPAQTAAAPQPPAQIQANEQPPAPVPPAPVAPQPPPQAAPVDAPPAPQPSVQPAAADPQAAAREAAQACDPGSVPVFYDGFKSVDPAWEGISADPRGGAYLADGMLVVAPAPDDDRYVTRNASVLRDAALCARVISPSAFQDPAGTGGGVFFWGSDNGDDYYDVMISPDGTYTIEKSVKGSDSTLAKEKSAAIKTGPGAVNEIKVVNRNNVTTFYLNGVKVQDIKGQPGKDAAYAGPYAWSERRQLNEWRYADIVMTQFNYGDEFTDFGVAPQDVLQPDLGMHTPMTVPGARVISTRELNAAIQRGLLDGSAFVTIDALKDAHAKTIRNAKRVPDAGQPGNFDDSIQKQVRTRLLALTKNNLNMPLVIFCEGAATCWESYNAVLRAEKMGFTRIYWYRGGLTAWTAAGLPRA